MIKLLEKKLKQKAEMFNFVKHLPISDYEIYAEIDPTFRTYFFKLKRNE